MITVLITGANGFIARHLTPVLKAAGMRVIGTARRRDAAPGFDAIYPASLGDPLGSLLAAEQIDAVVHTALDPGPHSYATNVNGTTRWLEEAAAAGVGMQILLSSLSADANALADYGRAKWALEGRFIAAEQVVFRLGVVVGDGGMFARLVDSARRYPVVPLLDNGAQRIYVLGIGFLCRVLCDCIQANGAGLRGHAWNIQQPTAYSLRDVIRAIVVGYGLRRALLPLPARPLVVLLQLFERQALIRLPITSTNVKGLIQQGRREFASDFARFGYPEEGLAALIARTAPTSALESRRAGR